MTSKNIFVCLYFSLLVNWLSANSIGSLNKSPNRQFFGEQTDTEYGNGLSPRTLSAMTGGDSLTNADIHSVSDAISSMVKMPDRMDQMVESKLQQLIDEADGAALVSAWRKANLGPLLRQNNLRNAWLRQLHRPKRTSLDTMSGVSIGSAKKRSLDPMTGMSFGTEKRNFDEIDNSGFRGFVKKNFDEIDRSGFRGFTKKNFDEIDRSGFRGFTKKNFDEIDRSGFRGFTKKNFDEIDRSGFRGFIKKNFDEIDRTGFGGFVKRNFDEIDRSGFGGFVKREAIPSHRSAQTAIKANQSSIKS